MTEIEAVHEYWVHQTKQNLTGRTIISADIINRDGQEFVYLSLDNHTFIEFLFAKENYRFLYDPEKCTTCLL